MELILVLIMSWTAVILAVWSMSSMSINTKAEHRTYKFISDADDTYLVRANNIEEARKEAKRIEILLNVKWSLIDEIDKNGDRIKTLYQNTEEVL